MRKHFAVVTLLLSLFAVSAFAQDKTDGLHKGNVRLSLFGTNFTYTESDLTGSNFYGGFGLALEYRFSDRWSGEIAASRETAGFTTIGVPGPDGVFLAERRSIIERPIDAVVQYHFFTRSAWKPFVGLGLRHVESPDAYVPFSESTSRTSAQMVGGVYYNITPRLSLRLDAKRLLRTDDAFYDDDTKAAIGFGWKF
jgi:outer membrane protein W